MGEVPPHSETGATPDLSKAAAEFVSGQALTRATRAALSFAYKHWDLKNPFACWIGMSESYVVLKAEK